MEDKVIPVAQAVRKLWIDPYNEETGTTLFMKMYTPKQVVLSGILAANSNGTGVMGTAEDGLKITLFKVNDFDRKSPGSVDEILHLLHHEFTHILNQKKAYPVAFNNITPEGYTGDWVGADEDPLTLGFVSDYARKHPAEDFAEMVANMLVKGKEGYEAYLHSTRNNDAGIQKLREKEALVVQYFKDAYQIDFYSLQTRVQLAKKAFMN